MVDLDPPALEKQELTGDLQDGMLAYYKGMAPLQDAQVEKRIEREPFFLDDFINPTKPSQWRQIG